MDCRRQIKKFLIGSFITTAGCATFIALAANATALRAARWLPADRQLHALTFEPVECLAANSDKAKARLSAIGRTAFRTPLLLGGQAARAGLSCNSCHRNGRDNPDFMFPGLSGAPGTADVTSSLMSSHRGDGIENPTIIPDLAGPEQTRKISHDENNQALENFLRGLIVEEFDGAEPSKLTIDGLATYVRMLSPSACKFPSEHKIELASYLANARQAMHSAQFALDAKDSVTARLMIASARTDLGMINERYAAENLDHHRRLLRIADLELAAIQKAIDMNAKDVPIRISTWLGTMPRWVKPLERDEALSLFNDENFPKR
jgi:hypothetical protein